MDIVRGDSFILALSVKVDGLAQDLTNWQIRSSIASTFAIVSDLTVTYTDRAGGKYDLTADTTSWPLGPLSFDIRYTTDAGQVVTTSKVPINVVLSDTP